MRTVWGNSMRRSLLLLSILLVVLSATCVSAITVLSVVADNCTFVQSSADCNTALSVSCQVYLTAPSGYGTGDMYLSSVTARVNGIDYTSTRPSSGSFQNGTWVMRKNMSYADANVLTQTIDSVSVKLSDGSTCTGSIKPNDTSGNCFVRFNMYQIPSTCNCTYTNSAGVKNIDNTMTYTATPGVGCSPSQRVVTYSIPYDYCDPQWTASYTACTGIFNNGTASLNGLTTKSYVAGDGGLCCSKTKSAAGDLYFNHDGGSDCTAPSDQGTFDCRIDPWAQYGDNLYATGGDKRISGFNYQNYTTKSDAVLSNNQPIVFDFNRNGFDEIFTLDESTHNAMLFTKDMVAMASYSLPGLTYNQPAMPGLSDYGGASNALNVYNVSSFVLNGNNYVVVTANTVTNASKNGFIYIFNVTSTITPVYNANFTNKLTGVNCYVDTCYYAELNGVAHKINVLTFADSSATILSQTNSSLTADYVPVFVSLNNVMTVDQAVFLPDSVVWVGYYTVNAIMPMEPRVIVTDFSLNVLKYYDANLPSVFIATTAPITPFKVVGSPVSIGSRVYWITQADRSSDNSTSYDMFATNLNAVSGSVYSVRNFWSGAKATGQCISNPVVLDGCGQSSVSAGGASSQLLSTGPGVGVEYSALTPTTGTSSFTSPTRVMNVVAPVALTGSPLVFVNPAGTVAIVNHAKSGTQAGFDVYDLTTGQMVSWMAGSSFGLGSPSVSYATFDDANKKAWVVDYAAVFSGGCPCTIYQVGLTVVDYSNMATVHSVFSYSWAPGSLHNAGIHGPPVVTYGGNYMYIPVQVDSNSTTAIVDIFSRTAPALNSTSAFSTARMLTFTGGQRIYQAYDANQDIAIMANGYYFNIFGSSCAYNNATCPMPVFISSAQTLTPYYNYQTSYRKFLNGANPNLKVLAQTIGSETITTQGCSNFVTLDYNADQYIFGYSSSTSQFGFCDFSNDASPKVTLYNDTSVVGASTNSLLLASNKPTISTVSGQGSTLAGSTGYLGYMTNTTNIVIIQYDSHQEDPSNGTSYTYGRALCVSPKIDSSQGFQVVGTKVVCDIQNSIGLWWCQHLAFGSWTNPQVCKAYCRVENITASYDTYGDAADLNSVVVPSGVRCGPITKGDVDVDGTDDIISTGGIASMGSGGSWVKTFTFGQTSSSNEWVVPVDLNADSYIELIRSSQVQQQLQVLTGKSSFSSLGKSSIPAVKGVKCSVSPGTGYAQITTAVQLPDPFYAQLEIDYGDSFDAITYAPGSTFFPMMSDGVYSHQYGSSGSYTVVVKAFQSNDISQMARGTATCTVNISQTSANTCALGADGEFNYVNSILQHNWFGDDLSPSNGLLGVNNRLVVHTVSNCTSVIFDAKVGLYPRIGGGIQLSDVSGTPYRVEFQSNGVIMNQDGANIGTWVSGDNLLHEVEFKQDRSTGRMSVYYDGTLMYSTNASNRMSNIGLYGYASVDYVRVSQSGQEVTETDNVLAQKYGNYGDLLNCDAQKMQDSSNIAVRSAYTNLAAYCGKNPKGKCDSYGGMQDLVHAFPKCTKEIYNYCVYKGYAKIEKIPVGDGDQLAGASTCAAVLGIGAGYSGVVSPVLSIVWAVITAKLVYGLILVLILVIFIPMWANRRRP